MKKVYLTLVMIALLALALAFAVSAESVHNENTVDYSETVTLNDGTVLPLFDENKEALVWYIDGKDENGRTKYTSAITDKTAKWYVESWNEVTGFSVVLEDGTPISNDNLVVVNMMDDDVVNNSGPGSKFYGEPVTDSKTMVQGRKNLEYFYLRLDTRTLNNSSFASCSKLKYINLEDLTLLRRMAQNNQFAGCTSLFEGQVLDLSRTQLTEFEGSGTFSRVPIKGIKFPETMTKIGSEKTFSNCTQLEFISIGNKAKIGSDGFTGCTALKAIYYVGTEEELNATTISSLIENPTIKSYAEYKALSDKSGVYVVYNYSRCEAFNQGVHGEITGANACVGVCTVCNDGIVNHAESALTFDTIAYTSYACEGIKTTACTNEGCTYRVAESVPAMFINLGYSVSEKGNAGIVIGFKTNKSAISEYEEISGKALEYGVFAVSKARLGENSVFDEKGKAIDGAICAKISKNSFDYFNLKIMGFSDEQKDSALALGAYVAVNNGEAVEYSYIQVGTPNEGENYSFVTYNGILRENAA